MMIATMLVQTARGLASHWYWKMLIAFGVFLFGGDRAVHLMYQALGVLMLLDLGTGVWKAKRARELSTHVGVAATLAKFASYAAVLVAARMLELIVAAATGLHPGDALIKVGVIYLAAQEALSIDENLRAINGIGLGAVLETFRRLVNGRQP